jgi:ABC-type polysaccharide/polyol phosphate export permease
VGLAAGMEVSGSALEVIAVIALALMFNLLVALFSIGVALRIRSLQAGPIIQTPLLIAVFLMPVYTPRALLSGWVQAAADGNPLTPVIEAARGLIVGQPERVALAFGISAGLIVLFAVFAATGLRRAENPIPSPRRARRRARRPTPRVAHESSPRP